jgi:signal transduction histidine kinase/CheY-like chemotaxis protein
MTTSDQTRDCQFDTGAVPCTPKTPLVGAWIAGGMAVIDTSGRLLSANDTFAGWLSIAAKELPGRALPELLGQRSGAWREAMEQCLSRAALFDRVELPPAEGQPGRLVIEVARQGESIFLRVESAAPTVAELESIFPDGCWGRALSNEVFHRMLRSEAQVENLMHSWPGIIFSQRPDYSFVFVSPKIEDWTGIPASEWRREPKYFWEVVHEADAEVLAGKLRSATESASGLTSTYRLRHIETGRVTYIWEHRRAVCAHEGLLLGFEGIWLDITRQTIAERRLLNMSWRENLGILTLGLAHDFCNVMTGIVGLSESFKATVEADNALSGGLGLIRDTAMQASQLAHRIRQLHQGVPGEKNYHDLNERLKTLVEVLEKVLPRRVRVRLALEQGQLPVYVDSVQLQQVVVNLALNAADAMPEGGELTFRTGRHQDTPATEHLQGKLPKVPLISLTVQDTGTGIPQRFLGSIFDPFFTSKPLGKGSGLGLYNVRLFAEQHNAAISVETRDGAGTAFHLWFPQSDFTEAQEAESAESRPTRRTLLVAGPAGEALDHLVSLLRQNGYYVVPARDEADAQDALRAPQYQLSGLVMLCNHGHSDGFSLCRRVRSQNLRLKIVLSVFGCNHDEVDTTFMAAVDAVIPFDLPAGEYLAQLKRVFDGVH